MEAVLALESVQLCSNGDLTGAVLASLFEIGLISQWPHAVVHELVHSLGATDTHYQGLPTEGLSIRSIKDK